MSQYEVNSAESADGRVSHYEAAMRSLRMQQGMQTNVVTMLAILTEAVLAVHDEVFSVTEELRELRLQQERIDAETPRPR